MSRDVVKEGRYRKALEVLLTADEPQHPGRIGYLAGDRDGSPSSVGHRWRNVLFALERRGYARSTYTLTHGYAALFVITDEGRKALGDAQAGKAFV